ncbi:MAG: DUF1624 domain-containing protein [Sphingobacteriia bacterium]|nr:DUF1624 domain-containing protein [Sphingobacteriia bacterium]
MHSTPSQRFTALDVFRGITICFMIIVNTSGNYETTWSPLLHAKWNGFTPTDLVFPSFLFAVGNAMSFVMKKWSSLSQQQVLFKILKRTAIIFLLGYLMYWFPFFKMDEAGRIIPFPISETRILGVLQRIALCYGIASLLIYFLKEKIALLVTCMALLAYWVLLFAFGDSGNELSLTGNAVLRLDTWLMGEKHLYHGEGIGFDPEGWLSTLPAVANVVAGFVVGNYVQQKGKTFEGLTKIMFIGFALLVISYFWNLVFPVNKKLWTSSFVTLTIGLDCIMISAVIYWIEFNNRKSLFFEVFGKNPLIIYLLSELLAIVFEIIHVGQESLHEWLFTHVFSLAGNYLGSFLYAVAYMLMCWCAGYWMNKKKIYVKV